MQSIVSWYSNNNNNEYYIACGQASYIRKTIKLKIANHKLIKTIDKVPNSIYLFDHIKKYFDSKILSKSRNITLKTITESEFIDEIESLFDGRKDIDVTVKP